MSKSSLTETELHRNTLTELGKALQNKEISSEELTKFYLKRIQHFNESLNCFISIESEENALKLAREADKQIALNQSSDSNSSTNSSSNNTPNNAAVKMLTGIPIAHKDIFNTDGMKTSCGSKMLDNYISTYDATVVKKLKDAHTILLGKTNMDEFAMGASNETSFYGPVKNPWNEDYVPGGSSGGSAAAVAARIALAATGTDTGGSIRQPAALSGITGIKPTYGRVSRYGMVAFASSLDQAGILAQTAEDCALLLSAISGHDPKDSTSIHKPVPDYFAGLQQSLQGLKIGLPREYFGEGLDKGVENVIQESIRTLEKLGATVKEISLPNTSLAIPVYYVIAPAECSSNLARYDGVRFGYRCKDPKNLEDLYKRTRDEGFGKEVKRRIMIGTYVLSAGYYDAYYIQAQKVRNLISNDFKTAFKEIDVILSPTAPTTAFPIGAKMDDPVSMYLCDVYTTPVNLAGLPGLSMPGGFVNNLPVGVQLIGNYFEESRLLNIAHQFQQQTDWHKQIPKMADIAV